MKLSWVANGNRANRTFFRPVARRLSQYFFRDLTERDIKILAGESTVGKQVEIPLNFPFGSGKLMTIFQLQLLKLETILENVFPQ